MQPKSKSNKTEKKELPKKVSEKEENTPKIVKTEKKESAKVKAFNPNNIIPLQRLISSMPSKKAALEKIALSQPVVIPKESTDEKKLEKNKNDFNYSNGSGGKLYSIGKDYKTDGNYSSSPSPAQNVVSRPDFSNSPRAIDLSQSNWSGSTDKGWTASPTSAVSKRNEESNLRPYEKHENKYQEVKLE